MTKFKKLTNSIFGLLCILATNELLSTNPFKTTAKSKDGKQYDIEIVMIKKESSTDETNTSEESNFPKTIATTTPSNNSGIFRYSQPKRQLNLTTILLSKEMVEASEKQQQRLSSLEKILDEDKIELAVQVKQDGRPDRIGHPSDFGDIFSKKNIDILLNKQNEVKEIFNTATSDEQSSDTTKIADKIQWTTEKGKSWVPFPTNRKAPNVYENIKTVSIPEKQEIITFEKYKKIKARRKNQSQKDLEPKTQAPDVEPEENKEKTNEDDVQQESNTFKRSVQSEPSQTTLPSFTYTFSGIGKPKSTKKLCHDKARTTSISSQPYSGPYTNSPSSKDDESPKKVTKSLTDKQSSTVISQKYSGPGSKTTPEEPANESRMAKVKRIIKENRGKAGLTTALIIAIPLGLSLRKYMKNKYGKIVEKNNSTKMISPKTSAKKNAKTKKLPKPVIA